MKSQKRKTKKEPELKSVIDLIAKAADDKKANDLKILDVSKTSNLVDHIIICSADSVPQIRAIEKEIDKQLKSNRIKGLRWEGQIQSGWLILDLGNIVVHVMGQEKRNYYNLEELWEKDAIIYHY